MKMTGSISGDLQAIIDEERHSLAADLRRGMEAAGAAVQADLRSQVRGAGLGGGLEKAWRVVNYPKNASSHTLAPASLVFSKAAMLHQVFSEGATISSSSGRYLAIPTREAEALSFATTNTTRPGPLGSTGTGGIARRASMVADAIAKLGAANTATLPIAKGRKLIVYKVPSGRGPGKNFKVRGQRGVGFRRGTTVPLFILVPQVRLRPRLDIESARIRAEAHLASEISAALSRG